MMAKWDQFVVLQRRGKKDSSADAQDSGTSGGITSALQNVRRALTTLDNPALSDRDIEYEFVEGTFKWLFEKPEFVAWRDYPSANPILWVTGEPGTGKTFLAYSAA